MDSSFNKTPGSSNPPVTVPGADAKGPATPAGNADVALTPGGETTLPAPPTGNSAPVAGAVEAKAPLSPAGERFHSCRWRKAAENGTPDHCTHRDVLPMAGTTGFVPESWCSDCGYFKAKRSPRKRPEEGQQDDWRRW